MKSQLLDYLRCPLCRQPLTLGDAQMRSEQIFQGDLQCTGCHYSFSIENGIPHMLSPQLPHYAEKMREVDGWRAMSQAQGWYEASAQIDLVLPDVVAKLGWDPVVGSSWLGTSHSFHDMFQRFARPGLRVLEIGAAKTWAGHYFVEQGCHYTGCDIMADAEIGLGRAHFFMQEFNIHYEVVAADAEALPFADHSFDLVFAVAALHHALDLPKMVGEMARVVKRGGIVAGLGEGVRAFRSDPGANDVQATELTYGINEHVYTLWDYYAAFLRHRLWVTQIYRAVGNEWFVGEATKERLRRRQKLPLVGNWVATVDLLGFIHPYDGLSIYSVKW